MPNPITILLFLFLLPCIIKGQSQRDTAAPRIRNIAFTTPVNKNTTINGLAIGFCPTPWHSSNTLNINGISVSASPVDPLIAFFGLLYALPTGKNSSRRMEHNSATVYPQADSIKDTYNGLVVG